MEERAREVDREREREILFMERDAKNSRETKKIVTTSTQDVKESIAHIKPLMEGESP